MKKVSITARIWLSVGVFAVGFVFSTVLVQLHGKSTESDLRTASVALFPAAQKSQEAQTSFERAVKSFGDAVIAQDPAAVETGTREGHSAASQLGVIAAIPDLPPENREECRNLSSLVETFVSDAQSVYGAIASNSAAMTPALQSRIGELAPRSDRLRASLQGTRETFSRLLQNKLDSTEEASQRQRSLAIWLFLGSVAAASVIVTLTIRNSIVGPILRVITGVRDAAAAAAHASASMSTAGQVVARDAHEQAACLQETSASLKEISVTTRQNSERAMSADERMTKARGAVQRASESMDGLSQSMNAISTSSREVAGVLRSLDEIAFNTNILALNAAVEAARAGEAGAGFSVVADEVRSLAKRAADAARHSADIVEKTIADVAQGVQYVSKAHAEFKAFSEEIESSAHVVSDIAESSAAQTRGISVIEQAVARLERVTQNNASNAEQTASSASSVTSEVEKTRFHLNELMDVVGLSQD